MVDRLIGVGGEFAAVDAEVLVEVDAGAEGEDAGGDSCEQSGGGAAAVVFEQELVFEAVDDRFDPLPDPADRWLRPVGLVGAAGPQKQRSEFADGGFDGTGAGGGRLGVGGATSPPCPDHIEIVCDDDRTERARV